MGITEGDAGKHAEEGGTRREVVEGQSDPPKLCKCYGATQVEASAHWQVQETKVLKNVIMSVLRVHYTAQSNAWIDSDVFEHWSQQQFVPAVKQHLQAKGLPCKAKLLIDNCAAHPDEDLLFSHNGQIKAVFLPPNTTSVIQSLDGGILETAKRNYRKCLLQRVLTENEGESLPSLLETIKGMTMEDVAYMAGEAWEDVKAESTCVYLEGLAQNTAEQGWSTQWSSSQQ